MAILLIGHLIGLQIFPHESGEDNHSFNRCQVGLNTTMYPHDTTSQDWHPILDESDASMVGKLWEVPDIGGLYYLSRECHMKYQYSFTILRQSTANNGLLGWIQPTVCFSMVQGLRRVLHLEWLEGFKNLVFHNMKMIYSHFNLNKIHFLRRDSSFYLYCLQLLLSHNGRVVIITKSIIF